MEAQQTETSSAIKIENKLATINITDTIQSIYAGLKSTPKQISSMFFYDALGSKLFEDITHLNEYYPTRTEKKLLIEAFSQLGNELQGTDIIELGSGDCSKISLLMDSIPESEMENTCYVPVDVSYAAIKKSADILVERYPGLQIHGFVADFLTQLKIIPNGRKHLFCFLGSTLGNMTISQGKKFFSDIGEIMHAEDMFLLGVDMLKPVHIIERAYNDNQNVTEAFNRNILNVINHLTGSNFNPEWFKHIAFFNEQESRLEMHLEADKDMIISSKLFPFEINISKGERIHTENSYKYTKELINDLLQDSGLIPHQQISDENNWFSLFQLRKSDENSYD